MVTPEDFGERNFRGLVAARADARHDVGAFGFREDVGHADFFTTEFTEHTEKALRRVLQTL